MCDKEYRTSYKLYKHFIYNKLKCYFKNKKYTHFWNFRFKEIKNEKTL